MWRGRHTHRHLYAVCSCPLVILHPGKVQGAFRVWILGGHPFVLGRPPLAPLIRAAAAFFSVLIEPSATASLFFSFMPFVLALLIRRGVVSPSQQALWPCRIPHMRGR